MQSYLLNFDDVLSESFLTLKNANALINGLNKSQANVPLMTPLGGLGNNQFTAGQTIVFDGNKMVSSGSGPATDAPLVNDDRYYTKAEVDAIIGSLAAGGGPPVAYANITGAPAAGVQLQFITPIQIASLTAATALTNFPIAPITGHTIVGALITVTNTPSEPGTLIKFLVSQTMTSAPIDVGWYRQAGSGNANGADAVTSLVPVDPTTQSFYYQLTGNPPGTVVATLIGYFFR